MFITADQWRWECLSILDHRIVKTPNLDALATDGVLFGSDHGDQLWDHHLLGKRAYFDQSFRVPLIIHAPGSKNAR